MVTTSPITPSTRAGTDEREATELSNFEGDRTASDYSNMIPEHEMDSGHAASNDSYLDVLQRSLAASWKRQVSASVPHESCRDHFGTLIPSLCKRDAMSQS